MDEKDKYPSLDFPGFTGRSVEKKSSVGFRRPGSTNPASTDRIKSILNYAKRKASKANPQASGIGGYPVYPPPPVQASTPTPEQQAVNLVYPQASPSQLSQFNFQGGNVPQPNVQGESLPSLNQSQNPAAPPSFGKAVQTAEPIAQQATKIVQPPQTNTANQPVDLIKRQGGIKVIRGNISGTGNAGEGGSFDVSLARPDTAGGFKEGAAALTQEGALAQKTATSQPNTAAGRQAQAALGLTDPRQAAITNNIASQEAERQAALEAERIQAESRNQAQQATNISPDAPSFDFFYQEVKKANPEATKAEIQQFYNEEYSF